MAVLTSYPKFQAFDGSGDPLSGGKIYTYTSGTSTPKTTYTDAGGGTPNTNPVILNSRGEASIWLDTDAAYRFIIKDSTDTTITTVDNIIGYQSITSGGVTLGGDLKISDYSITDSNANEYIKFTTTASAVNELAITDAATAGMPRLGVSGGDTNISLEIRGGKGTGGLNITDGNGNEVLIAGTATAGAVNEVTITNAATGNAPTIATTGGDTNIPVVVKGKGTGPVRLGQATSTDVRLEADQPIADSSGNELIKFTKVASAVNEITVSNNSTGLGPVISATGETNVPITVAGKGTGKVVLGQATSTEIQLLADQPLTDSSGNELLKFTKTASAVNEITVTNQATGTGPSIAATGGDTNIDLKLTPKGTGVLDLTISALNLNKGADIASASTTDIGAATGNTVDVTGTTTITALGTVKSGTQRIVRFTGILILTHHATSLILPSSANITTANGDVAIFVSLGSGNWKCVAYTKQDGTAIVASASVSAATQAELETGSSTTVYTSPGRQQYHPSAAKAWCLFNGTGTPAVTAAYNVTSITDGGTGIFTVNLTTAFATANFAAVGGVGNQYVIQLDASSQAALQVVTRNSASDAVTDVANISVAAYGDQ